MLAQAMYHCMLAQAKHHCMLHNLLIIEALDVVNVRAKAMQRSSELAASGMVTVLLNANHKIKYGCKLARDYCQQELSIENPVCTIASHLYTEAKVIAGHEAVSHTIKSNIWD